MKTNLLHLFHKQKNLTRKKTKLTSSVPEDELLTKEDNSVKRKRKKKHENQKEEIIYKREKWFKTKKDFK